jgi:hypothetical protein
MISAEYQKALPNARSAFPPVKPTEKCPAFHLGLCRDEWRCGLRFLRMFLAPGKIQTECLEACRIVERFVADGVSAGG